MKADHHASFFMTFSTLSIISYFTAMAMPVVSMSIPSTSSAEDCGDVQ